MLRCDGRFMCDKESFMRDSFRRRGSVRWYWKVMPIVLDVSYVQESIMTVIFRDRAKIWWWRVILHAPRIVLVMCDEHQS